MVAADGAASAVRKSLDLDFDGMTYEDRYLVLSTPFDMAAPGPTGRGQLHLRPRRVAGPAANGGLLAGSVPGERGRDGRRGAERSERPAAARRDRGHRRALRGRPPHDLPGPSAGGRAVPRRPGGVDGRRRPHQQPVGRHGHERRYPRRGTARGVPGRRPAGRHRRRTPRPPRRDPPQAGHRLRPAATPTRTPRAWPPPTAPPANVRWTGWPPGPPTQPRPGLTCSRPR